MQAQVSPEILQVSHIPLFFILLIANREIEIKCTSISTVCYTYQLTSRIHIAVIHTSTFCKTKATSNLSWYWELNPHYVK